MKLNTEHHKPKVLIVDDMHPAIMQLDQVFEVQYLPQISPQDIPDALKNVEILIIRSKIAVTKELLNHAPNLKMIARAGSGMDNIDLAEANNRDIICINCGEANGLAVAEQTLGMLLALSSNIVKGHSEISNLIWDREGNRGLELSKMTLGVIGFGHTGSAVSRIMTGFRTRILAYDKYLTNYASTYANVEESGLDDLFEHCDAVSLHIPLTEETNHWVDTAFVQRFRKPIFLLNLSRGAILKIDQILELLDEEKILGLGLDVLPNEKLETYSQKEREQLETLARHPKVVLTPHIGGWTVESYKRISELLAEKVRSRWKDLAAGKILHGYD